MKTFKQFLIESNTNDDSKWVWNIKLGDKILDTRTDQVGTVVKKGTSGNYTIWHIDFDGKIRKLNVMDYLQTRKPVYKLVENDELNESVKQLNENFAIKFKSLPGIVDFVGWDDKYYGNSNDLIFYYDSKLGSLYNPYGGDEIYFRFRDWNLDDVKKLLKDHGYDIGKQTGRSGINDKMIPISRDCFDSLKKELISMQKKYYEYFNRSKFEQDMRNSSLDKKIDICKDRLSKSSDNNNASFANDITLAQTLKEMINEIETPKQLKDVKDLVERMIKQGLITFNPHIKELRKQLKDKEK